MFVLCKRRAALGSDESGRLIALFLRDNERAKAKQNFANIFRVQDGWKSLDFVAYRVFICLKLNFNRENIQIYGVNLGEKLNCN